MVNELSLIKTTAPVDLDMEPFSHWHALHGLEPTRVRTWCHAGWVHEFTLLLIK